MAATELPEDFGEFLRLLNSHRAEYLVIGGYAVGHYGHPRFTADLDIWVGTARENAERVVGALAEFGMPVSENEVRSLSERGRMLRMGVPPTQIEILSVISGLEFRDAFPRGIDVQFPGVVAKMISLEDLKTNKKATGRLQDLADLEKLT